MRVFVSNISYSATMEDIIAEILSAGLVVESLDLPAPRPGTEHPHRGWGFAEINGASGTEILQRLHNRELRGRPMHCEPARARLREL